MGRNVFVDDVTQLSNSEIFSICRRQAPSPLLKAIARMAPPTGEGIAGTAFLSAGDALFRRRHTVFFVLLALLYERFIDRKSVV